MELRLFSTQLHTSTTVGGLIPVCLETSSEDVLQPPTTGGKKAFPAQAELSHLHQAQGLTEEVGEPGWLVVMDDGHAGSVESHQAEDDPVEDLGFHHVADGDAQESLLVPQVGGTIHPGTFEARVTRGVT